MAFVLTSGYTELIHKNVWTHHCLVFMTVLCNIVFLLQASTISNSRWISKDVNFGAMMELPSMPVLFHQHCATLQVKLPASSVPLGTSDPEQNSPQWTNWSIVQTHYIASLHTTGTDTNATSELELAEIHGDVKRDEIEQAVSQAQNDWQEETL